MIYEFRQGVVSTLQASASLNGSIPPAISVFEHGGDFTLQDLERYAQRPPAIAVSVIDGPIELQGGLTPLMTARVVCVIIATDLAQAESGARIMKDHAAMDMAEALLKELPRNFWGLDSAGSCLGTPRNMRARNLYSPALDAKAIAMWGVTWDQEIELGADLTGLADFATMVADYDVAPTDSAIDAQDTIDVPTT